MDSLYESVSSVKILVDNKKEHGIYDSITSILNFYPAIIYGKYM